MHWCRRSIPETVQLYDVIDKNEEESLWPQNGSRGPWARWTNEWMTASLTGSDVAIPILQFSDIISYISSRPPPPPPLLLQLALLAGMTATYSRLRRRRATDWQTLREGDRLDADDGRAGGGWQVSMIRSGPPAAERESHWRRRRQLLRRLTQTGQRNNAAGERGRMRLRTRPFADGHQSWAHAGSRD